MAPPTATTVETVTQSEGFNQAEAQLDATPEANLTQAGAKVKAMKFPGPPKFTDKYEEREYQKGRLALAFRMFGRLGFDEGVAGHITLRDPVKPDCFWVNPFGKAFSLMTRSDLLLIDHEGNVIDGGENKLVNAAAYAIHAAVHDARPDVMCAAHSHSLYGKAFCALGKELDMITQDSCAFYQDHAVYDSFNGVVLAAEEGQNIAKALGNKKAVLLQNHGLLTVGPTVEATAFWFATLERTCHAQLLADAAAGGRGSATLKIDPEDAAFTYRTVGSSRAGWFSCLPTFDVIIKEIGDEYLQ